MNKNYIDRIVDEFYNISDNDLMNLAQEYLEYSLWDEKIGYMSDLDYECSNLTATEIINNLDENFDLSDGFITVDECGYIKSYDILENAIDDIIGCDDLAKSIIEKGSCNVESIQEILDEMEKEEL